MSKATRRRSWLTALAVVGVALAINPTARAEFKSTGQAEGTDVVVSDNAFSPSTVTGRVGESVWFQLADDAQNEHHLAFDERPGVAIAKYMPDKPKYQRNYFAHYEARNYAYYCMLHGGPGGQGMSGVIKVVAAPPTTTTTAPPTTTTTARPAPTTTTTARPAMTAPPSTSQQGAAAAVTPTTITTSLAGAPVSPADVEAADVEAHELALEAASHQEEERRRGTAILIIAIGLAAALLGGAGWAWYHRPSRYHPA